MSRIKDYDLYVETIGLSWETVFNSRFKHWRYLVRQAWFNEEQGALDALEGTSLEGDFVILKQIYKENA